MKKRLRMGIAALFGVTALVVSARADEENVPLDKVPAPIMKAFKAKFPSATIKAASKEVEDGQTVFEIESMQNGLSIDALLKPDGTFVEIEQEIKATDLPAPIAATLKDKYPKANIKKAEKLTKGDKVQYETLVQEGEKQTELVFEADGKIVKKEEKSEKDDKD